MAEIDYKELINAGIGIVTTLSKSNADKQAAAKIQAQAAAEKAAAARLAASKTGYKLPSPSKSNFVLPIVIGVGFVTVVASIFFFGKKPQVKPI